MKKRALLVTGLVLIFAPSCATLFPNNTAHEAAARKGVMERTAFDLGCPSPTVSRLGDVSRLGQQMTRTTFGVTCRDDDGRERKGTYVVTCVSNWGDISCTPEMNTVQNESRENTR